MAVIFRKWGARIRKQLDSLGGSVYTDVVTMARRAQPPGDFVFSHLRTSGGSHAMNIDGSSTPVVFEYKIPTGKQVRFERMNMSITQLGIQPAKFAGISGGLANGIKMEAIGADGTTVLLDFNDGSPIKFNRDFTKLAGVDVTLKDVTQIDELTVRWTLSKAGAVLLMNAGQRIRMTIQDDLSPLNSFEAMLQGTIAESEGDPGL